jgi:hypothetical protein
LTVGMFVQGEKRSAGCPSVRRPSAFAKSP